MSMNFRADDPAYSAYISLEIQKINAELDAKIQEYIYSVLAEESARIESICSFLTQVDGAFDQLRKDDSYEFQVAQGQEFYGYGKTRLEAAYDSMKKLGYAIGETK